MIKRFLTEDFSSKWVANKNKLLKTGLVQALFLNNSKHHTNHITKMAIQLIHEENLKEIKSKLLNKMLKLKLNKLKNKLKDKLKDKLLKLKLNLKSKHKLNPSSNK